MAAINSYNSSRVSQLREKYSMQCQEQFTGSHTWYMNISGDSEQDNNSLKCASESDQHDSYQDIHLSFIFDEFAAKILL